MRITKIVVRAYQLGVSPILRAMFGPGCRYTPTCSDYFDQAVSRFGVVRGTYLGTKRILKCHPFSEGGYDPVRN